MVTCVESCCSHTNVGITHTHTHAHTHKCTHAHTKMYKDTLTCTRTCAYVRTHAQTLMYLHKCTWRTQTRRRAHERMQTMDAQEVTHAPTRTTYLTTTMSLPAGPAKGCVLVPAVGDTSLMVPCREGFCYARAQARTHTYTSTSATYTHVHTRTYTPIRTLTQVSWGYIVRSGSLSVCVGASVSSADDVKELPSGM